MLIRSGARHAALSSATPSHAARRDGDSSCIVHDMSFIERRSEETRRYLFYFFVALGCIVALITVVIAQLSWRGWVQGMRALLRGEGILRPAAGAAAPELRPIAARRARADARSRASVPAASTQTSALWTQQTLRATLQRELRGDDVIVVSNREPYIHVRDGGRHPRAASGERPRHGARAGDARVLGHLDRARQRHRPTARPSTRTIACAVPPDDAAYRLRRVWLTPEEEAGYYSGFANEGLWPLCHIAHVRPTFRARRIGDQYRAVNAKFADAVVAEAQDTDDPDRAGAGLPLRAAAADDPRAAAARRRSSRSGTSRGPTPRRSRSARGATSCSTACWAAASSASTRSSTATISSTPSTGCSRRASTARAFTVTRGGHATAVRRYPISIEWPPEPLARHAERRRRRARRTRSASACRTPIASASASTGSTTPRASSSASTRSTGCSSSSRDGSDASPSCRSPRPRAA